jgi:zinc/manganese transport system substrate-binding protein
LSNHHATGKEKSDQQIGAREDSKMKNQGLVALLLLLIGTAPAFAAIDVVTTTSHMGMLARTVGQGSVQVTVLAPPDRDPHHLQARPSMILALRKADLLIAVGAELEIGWLPSALASAANRRILPGQPGYFEGAAQVTLIERGQAADRSRGDVHPEGNPHFYVDPLRMAHVARALAVRLGALESASAARFKANAEAFSAEAERWVEQWKATLSGSPGVLLYHKDANYLTALFGVPVLGYIEPLPGIPPTGQHLRDLVARLRGQRGVILFTNFQSDQGPNFLARNLGWPVERLPLEPGLDATSADYFVLIGRWVAAIAKAKP